MTPADTGRAGRNRYCLLPRLAAAACSAFWLASCARPGAITARGREPDLRVALVAGAEAVRVAGEGRVLVEGSQDFVLDPGEVLRALPDGDGVRFEGQPNTRSDRLRVRSADPSSFVTVNGRPFRGSIEVYSRAGSVFAVNVVGLEAYLRGVVNAEMGTLTGRDLAALEAQAIVSRTYAIRNRGRNREDGYDVSAGVADQAYLGVSRETEHGNRAVANTTGLVITYRGELASVFYHSTCGYSTASPEEAFRSIRPVSYLQPVADNRPSGGYYCDISPRFRWTVEWDGPELRDILRRTLPAVVGVDGAAVDQVHDVRSHAVGRSRRVTELRIQVGGGEIPVFGPDIRRVLETPEGRPLGSNAIEIAPVRSDAVIERLKVSGAGWGHGVGMCQWGAIGRARAGHSAHTIITTYFPGTSIERWY
ncbi:MAG: SpoIID/LytB domain-containing protein [Gemmatimonadota bacterium]|nr:MAG: SpoIID/LytB domain-containing protein [Gemmatimonadota bacterium]